MTLDALVATLEAATRCHQAGELQQAEAAYRQVLALQPDQPEALHFLGILCYQTGRLEEAAAHLAKATQLRPNRPAFHSNLGAVYQALGKREAAIGCYSQAVALQPDYLQALFNLGLCHFQLGQYDQAEEYYRRRVELARLQPLNTEVLYEPIKLAEEAQPFQLTGTVRLLNRKEGWIGVNLEKVSPSLDRYAGTWVSVVPAEEVQVTRLGRSASWLDLLPGDVVEMEGTVRFAVNVDAEGGIPAAIRAEQIRVLQTLTPSPSPSPSAPRR